MKRTTQATKKKKKNTCRLKQLDLCPDALFPVFPEEANLNAALLPDSCLLLLHKVLHWVWKDRVPMELLHIKEDCLQLPLQEEEAIITIAEKVTVSQAGCLVCLEAMDVWKWERSWLLSYAFSLGFMLQDIYSIQVFGLKNKTNQHTSFAWFPQKKKNSNYLSPCNFLFSYAYNPLTLNIPHPITSPTSHIYLYL
jgi:hypothetical protein